MWKSACEYSAKTLCLLRPPLLRVDLLHRLRQLGRELARDDVREEGSNVSRVRRAREPRDVGADVDVGADGVGATMLEMMLEMMLEPIVQREHMQRSMT